MIRIVVGDLVSQDAGAVIRGVRSDLTAVNAVSRDIAEAAGPELKERLEKIGSMPVGGAVMTLSGGLSADFVIHVVVMSADEPQSLFTVQKALRNGLRRASDWALESVALPPLGIGVGSFEVFELSFSKTTYLHYSSSMYSGSGSEASSCSGAGVLSLSESRSNFKVWA